MNQTEENLQRLISLMGKRNLQAALVAVGTVQNIDEQNRSCEIKIDDDLTLFNCRLNAVLDSYQNHLLIVPKDQSAVAFVCVDGKPTDPLIIAYSEIDKLLLQIENTTLNIDKDKIEINGGDNKGLINIEDLKNNLDQLKNYVEALNTAVSTGLSAIGESTAASGTAGKTAYTTAMTGKSINFQDMEDTKITH